MARKEFVVIGVGEFGTNVAITLAEFGAVVMAVDKEEKALELIADQVTYTICADASNPEVLKTLGIRNYDGAIVGMGHDLETSVLITMQLKEIGMPYIMVKAATELEGRILHKVGADKVIFPDRETGIRVANQIVNGNYFEAIELSDSYSIVEVDAPEAWIGKTLQELNIRAKYNLNVIGIRSLDEMNPAPGANDILREGDLLIVLGHNNDLKKITKL